ncbi:acyloxyacyl hydrolase [Flavobacterium sp. NRK1]|uniref:acyloxyacyl hydrolase n=1 Tax=Flavobacterium sp. NRK1 TaxID=2954929 RepID=UPI002093E96F|nr:acyloxyacyl hydrolase [Flavobacterium sp. NRK1]MCO6146985.1 acyloxyacyl hydrolase [Flavobacterium sp. NRK1]
MFRKSFLFVLFCCAGMYAQEQKEPSKLSVGLATGFGSEFKNIDYTYTNRYIQAQIYYSLNPGKKWEYQVALQPEVNFATHRLKNFYFVKPDDPNSEEKREAYMKLKDIREYILNVAFFARHNFTKSFSIYAMGNVGPMITNTETERLTKGFAFCDVFALGVTYKIGNVALDVRPNVRHTSNAGLQASNAGFNTHNIAFGIIVQL